MSSSRSSSADSKSRSRSRSKSKSPDNRRSRSRSVSVEDIRHCRLHIGEIGNEVGKRDLERVFEKYGKIAEIWVARYPPMFAFVVFKRIVEAEEAMKACNGMTINGTRITVSEARPRRESRDVASGKGIRCYQCGRTGHFARDCIGSLYGYRRPPSRSPDRRRRRSRSPNGGGGYSSRRSGRDRDYGRSDRDRGDRSDRDRDRDRDRSDRDRDRRGDRDRERDRDRDSRRDR